MQLPQSGGCLCGNVRFTIQAEPMVMGICHCRDCQMTAGTSQTTQIGLSTHGVELVGETATYSRPADSGNLIHRHFCRTCGSPTHTTNDAMPDMIFLRAVHLDDPEQFRPMMEVYTASRPSWGGRFDVPVSFAKMPPRDEMPI